MSKTKAIFCSRRKQADDLIERQGLDRKEWFTVTEEKDLRGKYISDYKVIEISKNISDYLGYTNLELSQLVQLYHKPKEQ